MGYCVFLFLLFIRFMESYVSRALTSTIAAFGATQQHPSHGVGTRVRSDATGKPQWPRSSPTEQHAQNGRLVARW
jgi:hypothetical protein